MRPHGNSTGVGCPVLLQGSFPTQGLHLGLLYHRQMLYHLSYREAQLREPEDVIISHQAITGCHGSYRQSCHMRSLRKVPDISFILSKLTSMLNNMVFLSQGCASPPSSQGLGRQDPSLAGHLPSGIKTEARQAAPATIFDMAQG